MKYRVTLNGVAYEVEVEKGEAILVDEYELPAAASVPAVSPVPAPTIAPVPAAMPAPAPAPVAYGDIISSPIPGTIISVNVAEGVPVKAGQTLLVIEAMKMENDIVSPRDGVITQVMAVRGQAVNMGDSLVVLN